jgi:hypothetical protein
VVELSHSGDDRGKVWNRRILLGAVRSGEGPLTEHITATQAQPPERVFMVESGCGAVVLGRPCRLPPLSRRVGLLHWEGFTADIGVSVEAAIEAGGRLGPEVLEYCDPLVGHHAARIESGAVQRFEFFLQPAGADA